MEAFWSVLIIDQTGNVADAELNRPGVTWRSAMPFQNADWSDFGIRGRVEAERGLAPFTVRWKWDAALARYLSIEPKP